MALHQIEERTFKNPEGRVAIILSNFHKGVSDGLLKGVEEVFVNYPSVRFESYWVSGAFEIPLMAQRLAAKKICDVMIALGCIVKGDTYHFELVANECARGCMEVMLKYTIPVVFQVLACYSVEDGLKRSFGEYNHGRLAAYSALEWLEGKGL